MVEGTKLGPYEILGLIGAGGMGEVYRARDTRLGRDVAIKTLPSGLAADAERLKRFELEARAASQLSHPNILTIYDIGTADGQPYIVSELLEGENAARASDQGRPAAAKGGRDWRRHCRGAGGRSRARHRASRSQARESVPHARRSRQDSRLRDRQADAARSGQARGARRRSRS